MIGTAIKTAFRKKGERGWEKWPHMYWSIDLHDCIIPGSYTRNNEGRAFAPHAKEVLQWLTEKENHCIILWTSSHRDSLRDIDCWLDDHGIKTDYFNENPECENTDICDFDSKFYFDILLDDKAGFEMETDWGEIKDALVEIGAWETGYAN